MGSIAVIAQDSIVSTENIGFSCLNHAVHAKRWHAETSPALQPLLQTCAPISRDLPTFSSLRNFFGEGPVPAKWRILIANIEYCEVLPLVILRLV